MKSVSTGRNVVVSNGSIWGLQVLRFVAASMVLVSHLNHEVLQRPALARGFVPFAPVWWAGGVDIFFVISGFIMYHIAADQFGRPGAAWRFARRRLLRLVPPYWLFTLLALVAMSALPGQMAHNRASLAQIVGSFLFVPVLAPDGRPTPVLILGWTLEFEMMFYAVFALGLLFERPRGLMLIAAVLIGLVAAIGLQPLPMPLGFWANSIVLEFLFGIGIAMAYRRGTRLSRPVGAMLAIAGAAVLVWVMACGWPGVAWIWRFAWAGVPSAMICAGVALMRVAPQPGPVMRAGVFLGDASYALYLSHPFVLSAIAMVLGRLHLAGIGAAWGYIVGAFVACVAASAVIHAAFERPFHDWLSARLTRRAAPVSAPLVVAGAMK